MAQVPGGAGALIRELVEGNQQPLQRSRPECELRVSVSSPLLSSLPHTPNSGQAGGLVASHPQCMGKKSGAGTDNGQRPEQSQKARHPTQATEATGGN